MKKGNKNIIKVIVGVLLLPVILVLLLFVALYLPPVQKWAVDRAADYLSEEMGMTVSVERVLLKFPLDLSIGGVVAIQEPDTVLDAEELLLDVELLPLFKGEVIVDNATLKNTKVNTLDLIPALQIKGNVGELQSNDISFGLNSGDGIVPELSISDSELSLILADSIPEDTTEEDEEGFLNSINLQRVDLNRVAINLNLAPSADSMYVSTYFKKAELSSLLDLADGNFFVKDLKANSSRINWDVGKSTPMAGFDSNHINLTDVDLDIDSLSFMSNGDLYVGINRLAGKDRGGLKLNDAKGVFRMDTGSLYLDNFNVKTDETDLNLNMMMNLNAFDEQDPGILQIDANGVVGKADIMQFTSDFTDQFGKAWPNQTMNIDLSASGNMQNLYIDHLKADMDGAFSIETSGTMSNLMDPDGNIGMDLELNTTGQNLQFIKGFLPADARDSFLLPRGMALNGKLSMLNGRILADATLRNGNAMARLKADYNMNNESYLIDLDAKDFNVSNFVPLGEPCIVTGHIYAKGQGFDFDAPHTYCDANAQIHRASFAEYYLTETDMVASLAKQNINANIAFADPRLQGNFTVDGMMNNSGVDADMTLDLPFADVQALGFSPDPMTAHATHGAFKAKSNFGNLFFADAKVEGVQVVVNEDSIVTEMFDLYAESTVDSTAMTLKTGDLFFDFHSPNNLFTLIDEFTKVGEYAQKQLSDKALNLKDLKAMMPEATLHANIGRYNPISKFVSMQGYEYDELVADLHTSQEFGLQGGAHVYAFKTDSMSIDTVKFDIQQDSTHLAFNVGLACKEKSIGDIPEFTAYLKGSMSPDDADLRITYFDGDKRTGVDLGVKGEIGADSILRMKMYPEEPIIAFRKFKVNDDNFIELHKRNRMYANVFLQSTTDECTAAVYANPVDSQLQNINAVLKNLNIEELLTVLPFMPKMTGLLGLDASFIKYEDNYKVDGNLYADKFTYEGTKIGDLMAEFNYQPIGDTGHDINALIYHNDEWVATVKGNYGVVRDEYLDASLMMDGLPLSIASAFIPDGTCEFSGYLDGMIHAAGNVDSLLFNGRLQPINGRVFSDIYSFDLSISDDTLTFEDSHITLNQLKITGSGNNPLTINGNVDFSDLDEIALNVSLYGQNFEVLNAPRTRKSALFGKLYGDFFARVTGTTNDMRVRGLVNVLKSTNITYIMTNTPLTVDYRLDDIVTFVDFSVPPDAAKRVPRTFTGVDMNITLEVEDGAKINCEFSADKQSYVTVQGGGSIAMTYTPEGVLNLHGRYTINEGEMKYTLPVIPLKTFTLQKGSYIEFTGAPANPTLNISAIETTKASVSNADGSSRSVLFNVGLKITNTLNNMGLEFTIEAPEDMSVQTELAGMTAEEKNKLAVALLATGMYLSNTNSSGFSASNALNNFLQNEINNIAGKAVSTAVNVDMNVGMEQTKRDDGSTRTDYSFKFTKRFFSDRLNVVIGGRINADGNRNTNESGTYIDDISLEWRLDDGGTQYIRLFHDKNYDNIVEGELTENGAGILLRKKLDTISELFLFKKKKVEEQPATIYNGLRRR